MKNIFLLLIMLLSIIMIQAQPVVNGKISADVNVVDSLYTATFQINIDFPDTSIVGDVSVDYFFNNNGMQFVSGQILTFNSSNGYTTNVDTIGSQEVRMTTTLTTGSGISVDTAFTNFATLIFKIIDFSETSNLCPDTIRFYSPSSTTLWTVGLWDCDETPLPVELTLFTVSSVNNVAVLDWITATEVSNYGFDVERMYNDMLWEVIGFVEGHGNSSSPNSYTFKDMPTLNGTYTYRLKQIDTDGTYLYFDAVGIIEINITNFNLYQNYPNPFNSGTTIRYDIENADNVSLIVYDILGNKIVTLVNEYQQAGIHYVNFDASVLSSGLYIYRYSANNLVDIRKMTLLK